jgi:hypothetical protein
MHQQLNSTSNIINNDPIIKFYIKIVISNLQVAAATLFHVVAAEFVKHAGLLPVGHEKTISNETI